MYRLLVKSTKCQLTAALQPATVRFLTHAALQSFKWEDPLGAESLLTDEELAISETAESYCQERMLPRVLRMWMVCIP
jgi:glutaryl-CoA dehydrogenase